MKAHNSGLSEDGTDIELVVILNNVCADISSVPMTHTDDKDPLKWCNITLHYKATFTCEQACNRNPTI